MASYGSRSAASTLPAWRSVHNRTWPVGKGATTSRHLRRFRTHRGLSCQEGVLDWPGDLTSGCRVGGWDFVVAFPRRCRFVPLRGPVSASIFHAAEASA